MKLIHTIRTAFVGKAIAVYCVNTDFKCAADDDIFLFSERRETRKNEQTLEYTSQ